jgi:cadmium resistance protein CadD (predicted permease)
VVNGIADTVAAAAVMFAATNVDDAVVLTVLHAARRATGAPKQSAIWVGQYLGVGLMVVVALLAATGFRVVALHWVGLLGLIPLTRGIVMLATATTGALRGDDDDSAPVMATGWWQVTALTFANGGDNIAAYTAAFRIMGPADTTVTVTVFAAGIAVWCVATSLLVARLRLVEVLQRSSRWIIPVVFIALGVYIIGRSGLVHAIG